jgi:uroporphyrinogen decarboxylase
MVERYDTRREKTADSTKGSNSMSLYDRILSYGGRMVAPLAGYPGVKLINKSVRHALNDPTVQLEALMALEKRLQPDIVFTLMDLTVEAEALGLGVDFFEKKPPSLAAQDLPDPGSILQLDIPDPEQTARMPLFLRVAEDLAKNSERMCGAFVTGPFTLLNQMLGTDELFRWLQFGDPVNDYIGFATSVVGQYAASLASRVDIVVVIDPAAEAMKPSEYRSFYRPYISGLAGIIRGSGAECLLHTGNDVSHLLEEIALTGINGICLDSRVDLSQEAERIPSNLVLFGNIDPKRIIELGTVEDVRWEVRRLLRHMKKFRNFILSTGCDVPAGVPIKNLVAMMEEARSNRTHYG